MAQVKINSIEVAPNSRYALKKINFDVQKKDGSWKNQKREAYDHGNAVTVLLYNKEQRTVILIKQFRIATYINGNPTGMLIEACAGLLEEKESPEESIIREIKEETGYAVTEVQKIYEAYTSAGSITELLFLYVAEYKKDQQVSKGGGLEEEGEEIQILEIPFEEAFRMITNGEVKDAKTIMLLQYAKLNNLV